MFQNKFKKGLFNIFLIALLAFLATSSAFYNGLPGGNDLPQHYQFAQTIHQSIISGEYFPSLASDVNQGFGDYAIRFYPPMTYYFLSSIYLLMGDWFYASLALFFFIFWISGIGAYLWAREEFSPEQSLLTATLFIFAPYHINQIYNNFLFAEFASSTVIPFCFLFINRVCRKGKSEDICGLAISYAILILTHLPLTIIGSIVFGVYSLAILRKQDFFQTSLKLLSAVLLGCAASSFYWVRMISERQWLNHSGEKYVSTIYNYRENFLFRPQNILNFYDDVTCLWLAELMLAAVLLISIPSIILLIKSGKSVSRFNIAIGVVFLFSLFMVSPLSLFIWDNFATLQKVQFPWRWLGIISLCGSLFASGGIISATEIINQNKSRILSLGLMIILAFFVFSSVFIVKQSHYLSKAEFDKQLVNLSNEKSFDCWWMIWMKPDAFTIKDRAVSEKRAVNTEIWNTLEKRVKVSKGETDFLQIAVFYFPHWKAFVNGQAVEIKPNESGLISISMPPDESSVLIYFQEPLQFVISLYIAGLAWIVTLLLLSFRTFQTLLSLKINSKS
jgi:hypothetical protein